MKYLKLPLRFDAGCLLQDAEAIRAAWTPHHRPDHSEGWDSALLRSIDGDPANNRHHRDASRYKFTPYYDLCSYAPQVLKALGCEARRVRFLRLAPGGLIKRHLDLSETLLNGEVRLHIPVVTDPAVEFYIGGERIHMKPGELWYLNAVHRHWVRNASSIERIHFVADCIVNDALMDLIVATASSEQMARERRTYAVRHFLALRDVALQAGERIGERLFGAQYY